MMQSTKRPRNKRVTPFDHDPEALAWAIKKSGYNQTELLKALAAGDPRGNNKVVISKSHLSEMLGGTRNCRQPHLEAIAKVLNCPVVVLERKRAA